MPKNRAVISKKNPYWISKHRYYEICHFCFQYQEWRDEYNTLSSGGVKGVDYDKPPADPNAIGDSTANIATRMAYLRSKMELVENTAKEADPVIAKYILRGVTMEDATFNYLKRIMNMPCERDMYYDRRRKFYWLMSKKL